MFNNEIIPELIQKYTLNELIDLKIKIRFEIYKIIQKQKDLKATPEHLNRLRKMEKIYCDVFDKIIDIVQGK
jgi:hypothetical protein